MTRRRPSKHTRAPRPLIAGGFETSAQKSDGRYVTRSLTADRATKSYTCPGCNQTIAAGVAHVVAWPSTPPVNATSAVEYRRHWHKACWARKP